MGIQDLKKLPKVDHILASGEVGSLLACYPRKVILLCLNDVLDEMRSEISSKDDACPSREELFDELIRRLHVRLSRKTSSTLRKVVNATGTIIHTNLGRSLLPEVCSSILSGTGSSYLTLEYDLDKAARGSRYIHCEQLLKDLTGCEAALVVNNNAAAVLLAMNTLSCGKEAVVSRGELVEIGGSFRMPEVMEKSNAVMVEVGTTNRTRISDYAKACGDGTGLLVKVHRSNFKIVGFEEEATLEELVSLGRDRGVPVLHDLGGGLMVDLSPYGLRDEPLVTDSVKAGVDVITFSGDKLLGGPQAGIILGSKEMVDRLRKNPLTRALRVDKLTIAALEAVLRLYYDPDKALTDVPTLRMITTGLDALKEKASRIIDGAGEVMSGSIEITEGESTIGGGSFPGVTVKTIELRVRTDLMSVNDLEFRARSHDPPILGRIHDDMFILDMRTLTDSDEKHIIDFLAGVRGE